MKSHYYVSGAVYGPVASVLYRDYEAGIYVAMICTGIESVLHAPEYVGQCLIAHAVMDDFGSLAIVRGWK